MKITETKKTFTRTESGKSWKTKPDEVETNELTREQFEQCASDETCRFFRRLGGSETVTKCYTSIGYVPVRIISTRPDREIRVIREFNID